MYQVPVIAVSQPKPTQILSSPQELVTTGNSGPDVLQNLVGSSSSTGSMTNCEDTAENHQAENSNEAQFQAVSNTNMKAALTFVPSVSILQAPTLMLPEEQCSHWAAEALKTFEKECLNSASTSSTTSTEISRDLESLDLFVGSREEFFIHSTRLRRSLSS